MNYVYMHESKPQNIRMDCLRMQGAKRKKRELSIEAQRKLEILLAISEQETITAAK